MDGSREKVLIGAVALIGAEGEGKKEVLGGMRGGGSLELVAVFTAAATAAADAALTVVGATDGMGRVGAADRLKIGSFFTVISFGGALASVFD